MLYSFLFRHKGMNCTLNSRFWRRTLHMNSLHLPLIGALDQGTSSTRFILFDCHGQIVAKARRSINLYHPQANWVEQDPLGLVSSSISCIDEACQQVEERYQLNPRNIVKAIGITNQRETSIVWDKASGKPINPALVWMDRRTSSLLESISEIDSSNQLNLLEGRPHLTDVTNAHRTALLNLTNLQWDPRQLKLYDLSSQNLPKVRSSSFYYGDLAVSQLRGIPVTAVLGDQHASLYGHECLHEGTVKCTFGTGCFLQCNIGNKTDFISLETCLLKTIAYVEKNSQPLYALEAPMSNCGSAIDWAIEKLHLLKSADQIEHIQKENAAGVVFVPHLGGSLAPRWNPDDKGSFLNLSLDSDSETLILAILESIAFSIKQVIQMLNSELKCPIKELKVDGGVVKSNRFCQLLATVLEIPVVRPSIVEMTALGVAKLAAKSVDVVMEDTAISREAFMPKDGSLFYKSQYELWLRSCDNTCK